MPRDKKPVRSLLLLSLCLNALMGMFLLRPNPAKQSAEHTATARTSSAPTPARVERGDKNAPTATASTNAAPAFSWAGVESTDCRQYIANLRAIGCPEAIIHDIIMADVVKQCVKRITTIIGEPKPREYWHKPRSENISQDKREQVRTLAKEHEELLFSLLGRKYTGHDLVSLLFVQADFFHDGLDWLPEEKRAAGRRVFDDAGLRQKELADMEDSDGDRDAEKRKLERRLALLKDALSPAELEEYRMRSLPEARDLRDKTRWLDLTADEFKTILSIEGKVSGKTEDDPKQQEQIVEELRKAFGDARAEEYKLKTDGSYLGARDAVARFNLPEEAADRAVQIKRDALASADMIRANTALGEDARSRQLQALKNATRDSFFQLFGETGAAVALWRDNWLDRLDWLDQRKPPRR